MAAKKIVLHLEISEDGKTVYAEVADILDHLNMLYSKRSFALSSLLHAWSETMRAIDQTMPGADDGAWRDSVFDVGEGEKN